MYDSSFKSKTTSYTRSNTLNQYQHPAINKMNEQVMSNKYYNKFENYPGIASKNSHVPGAIIRSGVKRFNTLKETKQVLPCWNSSTNPYSHQSALNDNFDKLMKERADLAQAVGQRVGGANLINKLRNLRPANNEVDDLIYRNKQIDSNKVRPRPTTTNSEKKAEQISKTNKNESDNDINKLWKAEYDRFNFPSNNMPTDLKISELYTRPKDVSENVIDCNSISTKTNSTAVKDSSSNSLGSYKFASSGIGTIILPRNLRDPPASMAKATEHILSNKEESSEKETKTFSTSTSENTSKLESFSRLRQIQSLKPDEAEKEYIYSKKETSEHDKTEKILNDKELSSDNNLYLGKKQQKFPEKSLNSVSTAGFNPSGKLVGLQNLGNTCFMNTSLQCIIHSNDFIQALNEEVKRCSPLSNCPTRYFHNLLVSYNSATSSVGPYDFKNQFSYKHSLFSGYQQHDSQEFCRILLEDISTDLNRVKKKTNYEELKTDGKIKTELNLDYHNLFLKREDSIVVDYFYGQFCNTFTCLECGLETYSYEKFLDIPILLNDSDYGSPKLSNLLANHLKEENIQWGVKCEKCGKKSMHRKKSKISILPEFLIISFQRYDFRSNRKITSSIGFSETLDIKPFADLDCIRDKNDTEYDLYAISNHSGSLHFGHYYAYVKVNNRWHEFNDSHVSSIGGISTSSSSVYVLFYQKSKR